MLLAMEATKRFDDVVALDQLTCTVPEGVIYGLVGSNGSGKSTFLRLLAGIYCPEAGRVTLGDADIFEDATVKEQIVIVPDELFFLPQASLNRMASLYANCFPHFSSEYFDALVNLFQLDRKKAIRTFSKGMKRQAAIILALACRPKYLLLDEAFDGLDPMMRNVVRQILSKDVEARGTTVVISSHSLRELEDTCDWLALLHNGKLIFENAKADLMVQAPNGLEALFVERLSEAGHSFTDALAAVYAQQVIAMPTEVVPPPPVEGTQPPPPVPSTEGEVSAQ